MNLVELTDARCCADHGANVSLLAKSHMEPIKALREEYGKDRVHGIGGDLANEESVSKIFLLSLRVFGPVQVIIVNHGIWPQSDTPLADMTLEQWNGTLQTNLTSSFLVCREYLKDLREPTVKDEVKEKASIVLVGSTAGKYGEAGHADYACSKSGEFKNFLIRVCIRVLTGYSK